MKQIILGEGWVDWYKPESNAGEGQAWIVKSKTECYGDFSGHGKLVFIPTKKKERKCT